MTILKNSDCEFSLHMRNKEKLPEPRENVWRRDAKNCKSMASPLNSAEKFEEFFFGEGWIAHGACVKELVSKLFFSVLESDYALFDCVLHDEAVYGDDILLADSVRSVGCLILDRNVPPVIEVDYNVGTCKIKTCAAGF